jgi:hypothetical protein
MKTKLHFFTHSVGQPSESWKKLHVAHKARADIYIQIEDILVQKSRTFVAIADLCCDFYLI